MESSQELSIFAFPPPAGKLRLHLYILSPNHQQFLTRSYIPSDVLGQAYNIIDNERQSKYFSPWFRLFPSWTHLEITQPFRYKHTHFTTIVIKWGIITQWGYGIGDLLAPKLRVNCISKLGIKKKECIISFTQKGSSPIGNILD